MEICVVSMIDLFPEVTTPYYIATPSWTHKSSGVRVLHLLAHCLNESGQKAYLIPFDNGNFCRNPHLNTPLLDSNYEQFYNHLEIEPAAVYPDVVHGNPYNCKKVVRYLLAEASKEATATFKSSDKIYHYRSDMGSPTLCLPTFDPSIFYPPLTLGRSGTCFYSCKYEAFGNKLLPITENSIRLNGSHEQIANTLRECEKLYLYEHSEVAVLARMCSCPVEEVTTSFWNGTAENWQFAKGDPQSWMVDFEVQLKEFIEDTQDWK